MSFDDEINRLKEEIEKAEKEATDRIQTYSSMISDLESRFESEANRERLLDILGELRGLKHQIKSEAMRRANSLKHDWHEARDKIRSSREYATSTGESFREEMDDRLEEMEDYLGDKRDEIEDKIDSLYDKVDEVEDRIKEKVKEMRHTGRVYADHVVVPEIRVPEIKIPDFGKMFSESFSKSWTGVPSAIVSSVRLPQADLGLIDTLANAGIFKSRNEGIAFFAHRGIEASEDWLNKVKEKLADIKKLQEETKREIDKVIGVPIPPTPPTPSPAPSATPKSDEEEEQGEKEGEAQ